MECWVVEVKLKTKCLVCQAEINNTSDLKQTTFTSLQIQLKELE